MRWLLKGYEKLLHSHPVVTQSVQTGLLMATGDVISQVAVEKQPVKELNVKRTVQFFAVGAFYVGPALSVWYKLLDKHVGSGGKTVALKKVALDQLCVAPCLIAGFLVAIDTLQGKTWKETKESIREKYGDILIANYKLWPAAQLINFYFVPLHHQVLYAQCVALFWNVYICYKTRPVN